MCFLHDEELTLLLNKQVASVLGGDVGDGRYSISLFEDSVLDKSMIDIGIRKAIDRRSIEDEYKREGAKEVSRTASGQCHGGRIPAAPSHLQ